MEQNEKAEDQDFSIGSDHNSENYLWPNPVYLYLSQGNQRGPKVDYTGHNDKAVHNYHEE